MRVLAVTAPLVGHLAPLLPLATALRDAGHDVLLATGGDAIGLDVGALPREDVAPGVRFGRIAAQVALAHPRLAVRELSGRAGTGLVGELFGEVNGRMADAVVALARRWHPDLVLHESLAAAGAVAAAVVGVPAVLQESNLWDGTRVDPWRRIRGWTTELDNPRSHTPPGYGTELLTSVRAPGGRCEPPPARALARARAVAEAAEPSGRARRPNRIPPADPLVPSAPEGGSGGRARRRGTHAQLR